MSLVEFNQEPIKALLVEVFTQQAQAYLKEQAQPDPQFTFEEVAEILGLDVSTVRSYLKLPSTHQRHLPFVQCTDSPRGNRVRLSAIRAWQERNSSALQEAKAQEPEKILRISHRRAARRKAA